MAAAGGAGRRASSLHTSAQTTVTLPTKIGTFSLSWLMLTDIVGTGVLTLAGVASQLGWAFVVPIIIFMCPVAVYSAVMMVRTRVLLIQAGFPAPTSLGHAATLLAGGSRCAGCLVYTIVYGFALLGNASYLLVIGNSLQGAVYAVDQVFCLPAAVGASVALLLPLVVGMRWLKQSVWICFFNMLIMLAAIVVVMVAMVDAGRAPTVHTHAVAPGKSGEAFVPGVRVRQY
jgi:hypothetical protein